MKIWINGEVVDAMAQTLPALSAGVTLGWGVFTTAGVWHGQAFLLERHLQRLRRDAARTYIPLEYDDDALIGAVTTILEENQISAGLLRITLLRRGDGRWNSADGSDLFMTAKAAQTNHRTPSTQGLRIVLSPFRVEARRALAGVKSTSCLDYQLAWQQAARNGFDETVICNGTGALCEGARSNLFWVRDGRLYTPSIESGCLPGIARELVLQWAAEESISVKEGLFAPQELAAADEVFLTSATQGPRAVSSFSINEEDDQPHRFAMPGNVTGLLRQRWQQTVDALR